MPALLVRVASRREKRRIQKMLLSPQGLICVEYVKNGSKKYQDDESYQIETYKTFCKEQFTAYQCKQITSQAKPKIPSLSHRNLLCLLYGTDQRTSFTLLQECELHTTKSLTDGVLTTVGFEVSKHACKSLWWKSWSFQRVKSLIWRIRRISAAHA